MKCFFNIYIKLNYSPRQQQTLVSKMLRIEMSRPKQQFEKLTNALKDKYPKSYKKVMEIQNIYDIITSNKIAVNLSVLISEYEIKQVPQSIIDELGAVYIIMGVCKIAKGSVNLFTPEEFMNIIMDRLTKEVNEQTKASNRDIIYINENLSTRRIMK